jgi:hypothetical protein
MQTGNLFLDYFKKKRCFLVFFSLIFFVGDIPHEFLYPFLGCGIIALHGYFEMPHCLGTSSQSTCLCSLYEQMTCKIARVPNSHDACCVTNMTRCECVPVRTCWTVRSLFCFLCCCNHANYLLYSCLKCFDPFARQRSIASSPVASLWTLLFHLPPKCLSFSTCLGLQCAMAVPLYEAVAYLFRTLRALQVPERVKSLPKFSSSYYSDITTLQWDIMLQGSMMYCL